MSSLLAEQQALLARQLHVLARIEQGIAYSLTRMPAPLRSNHLEDPEVAERISSLIDRCTKLQDQFAGALKHAHSMLGERYRSYSDVVTWAVRTGVVPQPETWLELRALRNRLTHEYDLDAEGALELVRAMRDSIAALSPMIRRFEALCSERGLVRPS